MRHLLTSVAFLAAILGVSHSQAANQPVKEWTFLVYLNGDNSLDSYGPLNLNQMEKIGSSDQINIVVQWASIQNGGTKRLYIQKDNDLNNVTSPVIQNMGTVDMGSYQSLVDFVQWGVANYPAQHYFIDVWDHGGGWHFQTQSFQPLHFDGFNSLKPTDISWDDNSGHFMTTKELGVAMTAAAKIIGHKVDIYGSDACLMAMPEVAAEMVDSVGVYAGSEEVEPAAGWPYDTLLEKWNATPNATAIQVGKILTDAYVASYENGSNGTADVTFSTFDMAQFGKLNTAVSNLSQELNGLDVTGKQKALQAIGSTTTFSYNDYGDLADFTNQLGQKSVGVRSAVLDAVGMAISDFVVDSKVTSKYSNAKGVSIWLPASQDTFNSYWTKYSQLVFEQTTHWGDAIKTVLGIN